MIRFSKKLCDALLEDIVLSFFFFETIHLRDRRCRPRLHASWLHNMYSGVSLVKCICSQAKLIGIWLTYLAYICHGPMAHFLMTGRCLGLFRRIYQRQCYMEFCLSFTHWSNGVLPFFAQHPPQVVNTYLCPTPLPRHTAHGFVNCLQFPGQFHIQQITHSLLSSLS